MTFLSFSDAVAAAEPVAQGLRKLPEAIEWSYSGPYELNVSDLLPIFNFSLDIFLTLLNSNAKKPHRRISFNISTLLIE